MGAWWVWNEGGMARRWRWCLIFLLVVLQLRREESREEERGGMN